MKKLLVIFLMQLMHFSFAQTSATISVNLSSVWGQVDSSIVGFSFNPAYIGMNFSNSYNGINTRAITTNLFNNFYPFQQPAIRINGTNNSYWKNTNFNSAPSVFNVNSSVYNCVYCPSGSPNTTTAIDASDLNNVQSFVNSLSYKPSLYWGINMTFIDTARVTDFCSNIKSRFTTNSQLKFELGNEPDAFLSNARRLNGYDIPAYVSEFNFIANKVKNFGTIVAPALAKANPTSSTSWADSIGYIVSNIQSNNVTTISYHDYPLGSASSGTVSGFLNKYLSDSYTADDVRNYTTGLYPSIKTAQQNGLGFRLAEANTIASGGFQGASDVMGSALWGIDMMFELARMNTLGINFAVEGSSTTYYSPFTFNSTQVTVPNKVLVTPLYYGSLLFARAAQNRANIISNAISNQINNPNIKVWTVVDKDKTLRVVIINRGTSITDNTSGTFTVSVPSSVSDGYQYNLLADNAPNLQATAVSICGQKVDGATGALTGSFTRSTITPNSGNYTVVVPAGTATILEIAGLNCVCN